MAVPYSFAVLATVRATPGGYIQILRRFDLLALHNIVTPVVRLLGTLLIIAFDLGLTAFLVAWLVAALVEGISLWIAAIYLARRHMLDQPLLGAVTDARSEHEGLGRFILTANADIMLGDLTARLTPLIIGAALGPAAAGLYSIAHRATVIISQPAQMLGQAAYAELARLAAVGRAEAAVRLALTRCIGIALATTLPLLVIVALFAHDIAVLIGGPRAGNRDDRPADKRSTDRDGASWPVGDQQSRRRAGPPALAATVHPLRRTGGRRLPCIFAGDNCRRIARFCTVADHSPFGFPGVEARNHADRLFH